MERCNLLTKERERVKREELGAWKTRHIQKQPETKKKGPVEPEKEKEKEKDEMEDFFCQIYEFHIPAPTPAVFVPAALPPRYAISFVPAVSVSASVPDVVPSSPASPASPCDYSVVSTANFVVSSVAPSFVPVPFPVPNPVGAANIASAISVDDPVHASTFDFSIVSSANFVVNASPANVVADRSAVSPSCIESNT